MTKRVLIAVWSHLIFFFTFYKHIDASILMRNLTLVIKTIIAPIMRRKIPVDTEMVNDGRP